MAVDPQTKILLVEDAGTMRKMEARILNQLGFENIIEAADGDAAIAKIEAETGIGLVISDWAMPNKDGYELLRWLREQERFRDIPFIMATGHGDKEYVAKAKDGGANGVVAKPFSPDELRVVIDEAFGVAKEPAPVKDDQPKVSSEGKVRLKMAHIQITDHLALGVLKHQLETGQKGAAHFNLETRCMASWNPVQKALEDGEVDGAFILAPAAMDLFSYDVPIRLVLFAHRNGSICVRNKTGKYAKPYQQFFKHKTFLIPHKMSIHNMLAHMYFSQLGLRPGVAGREAVNVLFDVVPPIGMPEFLRDNDDVCGFMVAEPIGSRAIAAGLAERQFLSSEIWEDHPCCVIVFRDEFIRNYADAVQEFCNMIVESGKFIEQNVDQAAEIAVEFLDPQKKLGLEPALLRNVLSDPMGIKTNDLYPAIEDLETIQQYMTAKMEIGRPIDLAAFVDTRFADKACGQIPAGIAASASTGMEDQSAALGSGRRGAKKLQVFGEGKSLVALEGKYLIFSLGSERFGLGILDVREIIGLMPITAMPNMPDYFNGVINLRDKVIPVLDMRRKFGMEPEAYHARTCIIVVEISGRTGSTLMGVIVDSVAEVAYIKEEQIDDPPELGLSQNREFITGMAKLPEGVTILLDIDRILHRQDRVSIAAVA